MDEAQFRQQCRDQGFGEPETCEIEPRPDNDMHSHDFSDRLMVMRGEFVVETADGIQARGPGDICSVPAGTMHAERVGSEGATILLARK